MIPTVFKSLFSKSLNFHSKNRLFKRKFDKNYTFLGLTFIKKQYNWTQPKFVSLQYSYIWK